MDSLSLSASWDLEANTQKSIKTVSSGTAIAQNVASTCRTFKGETTYNTDLGIPYMTSVFGSNLADALLASLYEDAALATPGVSTASASLIMSNRKVTGEIRLNDTLSVTL